jgi:hypothetical protein
MFNSFQTYLTDLFVLRQRVHANNSVRVGFPLEKEHFWDIKLENMRHIFWSVTYSGFGSSQNEKRPATAAGNARQLVQS